MAAKAHATRDVAAPPTDLTNAAERLLTQAVSTIRTLDASDRPAIEARLHDASLGDVRVVVTGRMGEIVQADLIVKSRASAEALAHTARLHSADLLAGVNVTVRADLGGTLGERAGRDFAWTAAGDTSNPNASGGQQPSAGGQSFGQQSFATELPDAPRTAPAPRSDTHAAPDRPRTTAPRVVRDHPSSLDVRA